MPIKRDEKKNELLKAGRKVSFEDVEKALAEGKVKIINNKKPGRKGEEVIIFLYNNYPYECAFVKDKLDSNKRFLKTIHKERKYKKLFNL